MGFDIQIRSHSCYIACENWGIIIQGKSKIAVVYEAIIELIQWYNQNH